MSPHGHHRAETPESASSSHPHAAFQLRETALTRWDREQVCNLFKATTSISKRLSSLSSTHALREPQQSRFRGGNLNRSAHPFAFSIRRSLVRALPSDSFGLAPRVSSSLATRRTSRRQMCLIRRLLLVNYLQVPTLRCRPNLVNRLAPTATLESRAFHVASTRFGEPANHVFRDVSSVVFSNHASQTKPLTSLSPCRIKPARFSDISREPAQPSQDRSQL